MVGLVSRYHVIQVKSDNGKGVYSSAMVINMDFLCQYIVTDIKQTCLGQGLRVTITARKRTSKVKNLGHTSDL